MLFSFCRIKIAVLAGLVFLLSSCAGSSVSIKNPSDHQAGAEMAEKLAKQDAMKDPCTEVFPFYRSSDLYKNLNRHLDTIKAERSSSFVQGFAYRYKQSFKEYINLYCDY